MSSPKEVVHVANVRRNGDSLFMSGKLNGKLCNITVDTGASRSIVKAKTAGGRPMENTDKYLLRTATGEVAKIYGELTMDIELGGVQFPHTFLAADIIDECILGVDFMVKHDILIHFRDRTLMFYDLEIPLMLGEESGHVSKVVVYEDVELPPMSETIVWTRVNTVFKCRQLYLVEPEEDGPSGVMTAKTLIKVNESGLVPVRVMNVTPNKISLKENEAIGSCAPVIEIVSIEEEGPCPKAPLEEGPKIVKQLLSGCQLNSGDRRVAEKLLDDFVDVFALREDDHGRTGLVKHRIDTGEASPIRQPPRRLPLAKRTEVENMIKSMEEQGIIEESSSPWASPVVLVKKKDGDTRFCVDYRRLNDVTRKDSYPLPRIDDTLDTLSEAKWFSTLDLKSGYWQVEVHPDDREKTAFSVGSGLMQFKVLPFGLCNASATFERLMDCVLRGLTWKTCLVYLDDIIVFGKTFEEHISNLRGVFQRLRGAHLKLSPKKCHLFRGQVKYLGHVVSSEGVSTDPEKIEAVRTWPIPKDRRELRSFLGLASYYRRFIKGFANTARSLHQLTEKGRPFLWTDMCDKSFEELKGALCKAPVLRYPKPGQKFILDTDASNHGIGAVLSQVTDGEEAPVAYFSKTLSKAERNYCVTRKELLAVILATKHFHKYLYGQKFVLRTDHAALKWLMQFKNLEGQVARWVEQLQTYDFEIQHRKGRVHSNADALSRRPCKVECKHCFHVEGKHGLVELSRVTVEPDIGWNSEELREAQKEDEDISPIVEWKDKGARPSWKEVAGSSEAAKSYWAQWDSLVMESGVLKRKWETANGKSFRFQIVVPRVRVKEVLDELHSGSSGGHLGVNKTLSKVRERFYWIHMRQDVEDWCRRCTRCAGSKGPRTRSRGEMQQYVVGAPFERIAMDIAGPFPETNNGNRYLLVAMDYFSKWPEVYPIPNQEATTVADQLVNDWISRFGVPLELHTDQGRNFESNVFQEVCKLLGIRKTRTTPLHPQSDGMVERFNRTLLEHLRKVVGENQREWDRHIPLFLMSYRSAVHSSTGQAPASVIFGHEFRLPSEIKFGVPPTEAARASTASDYVADLRGIMAKIHRDTRQKLQISSDRMKTRYDLVANSKGFNEGERVWLYNPKRRKSRCPKLQQNWEGPYKVVTRINDVVYRIQRGNRGATKVVHLDRLAPYFEPGD